MAKTWKQIETSRERRLWFTQVIIPSIIIGGVIFSKPEVREFLTDKINRIKAKVKK